MDGRGGARSEHHGGAKWACHSQPAISRSQLWRILHEAGVRFQHHKTWKASLNLIECQFQALRSFALNGSDHGSHAEQDGAIRAYLRWHNRNARPAKPWRIKAEVHHSLPNVAA